MRGTWEMEFELDKFAQQRPADLRLSSPRAGMTEKEYYRRRGKEDRGLGQQYSDASTMCHAPGELTAS